VKLDPSGRHVLRVWTGFTAVTGVAVGWDGTLYVSQLFAPQAHPINPIVQGVLTKICPSAEDCRPVLAGVEFVPARSGVAGLGGAGPRLRLRSRSVGA